MCRFAGDDDIEYENVAAAFQQIILTSAKVKIWKGRMEKEGRRQKLIDSLSFSRIDTQIKGHSRTHEWLPKVGEYANWLAADGNRLLVIRGESGTGKSTLRKSASDRTKEEMKDALTIRYFVNRTGDHLEKSITGMCRSLLTQILRDDLSLQYLDTFESAEQESQGTWTIGLLKTLLAEVIQILWSKSIICFVDGLNEFKEEEAREIIAFCELLCDIAPNFRVCISSGHSSP